MTGRSFSTTCGKRDLRISLAQVYIDDSSKFTSSNQKYIFFERNVEQLNNLMLCNFLRKLGSTIKKKSVLRLMLVLLSVSSIHMKHVLPEESTFSENKTFQDSKYTLVKKLNLLYH